jgi:WD40 repeat protein
VAFDPDGRIFATGGVDGTKLWHLDSGKLYTTLDTGPCRSVAFSPRNHILATANGPSEATLWEFATGVIRFRLTGHAKFVAAVVFNAEGDILVTGSAGGTIILWKPAVDECFVRLPGTPAMSTVSPCIRMG